MTNKDMVPRPGPGPRPKKREAPKTSDGPSAEDRPRSRTIDELLDPPDSPQVKPLLNRK